MTIQTHTIQLVSIETAASLLDVSRSSIRRLIKNKRLPALKIGGQVRIRMVDLRRLIEKDDGCDGA
jgi:excisionase family DNA binding protein